MISDRDVAFYGEHGYLVVPDVLDAATLDAARLELRAILEGARSVSAHTDVYGSSPATARTPHGCAGSKLRTAFSRSFSR
jgi:hypothetical protein